jgi:hypothetical protein
MRLRCANPTLLIYLAWVYALPALLNTWLDYQSDLYVNTTNGLGAWLYGGLLLAIAAAFAFQVDWRPGRRAVQPLLAWRVPQWMVVGLLGGVLVVAALGATAGLSRWRYAEEGLSGSLDPMSLLFVLTPNVLELTLFAFLFFHYELPTRTTRTILLMLSMGLALTASGIGPMLTLLLALVATLAPDTVRRLLLNPYPGQQAAQSRLNWRKLILLSPLVGGLGVLAYLIGDAIKTGSDLGDAIDSAGQDEMGVFLDYLVGRISVQWYSLVAALHQCVELGRVDPFQNLMAPVTNAGFRFSSLTGGWLGIERPQDGSLARINYGLINLYPFNDREGTTPGLIATFVLTLPVWLGPFALMGYLWCYDKVQSRLRRRFAGRPTLFGELMLLYFTAVFFSSPADFLLVFDPMLLTLFAWCYLGLSSKPERKPYATIHPSH